MNILLIDDSAIELKMLHGLLEQNRPRFFTVHWAPNIMVGKDILETLPSEHFSYVFIDVMGTSLDWKRDVALIHHQNMYIISGIAIPIEWHEQKFMLKEEIVPFLLSR